MVFCFCSWHYIKFDTDWWVRVSLVSARVKKFTKWIFIGWNKKKTWLSVTVDWAWKEGIQAYHNYSIVIIFNNVCSIAHYNKKIYSNSMQSVENSSWEAYRCKIRSHEHFLILLLYSNNSKYNRLLYVQVLSTSQRFTTI